MIRANRLRPTTIGLLGGAGSAIFYTVTNILLRKLGDADPVWVSTIKAIPTLLIVLPIVALQIERPWYPPNAKRLGFVSKNEIAWLIATSIVVQIFGNVAFQWALQIVGLTISIPIVLGTMLIGGAILGKLVLNEPVSQRKVVSMFVLTLATVMLSLGAKSASGQTNDTSKGIVSSVEVASSGLAGMAISDAAWVTIALLAVVASGIAYAWQGTMMRRGMQRGLSVSATLGVISGSGVLFLVVWSLMRVGPAAMLSTPISQMSLMIAAGVFNAIAFFSMGKSLQHVSVLYVQLLNVSQVAISAVAGWALFSEQMNLFIVAGLGLTALGLVAAGFRDEHTAALEARD